MFALSHRRIALGAFLALGGVQLDAATVVVAERSSPPGIISNSTTASTAEEYLTVQAPLASSTNRFIQWLVQGVRQQDSFGRSVNPARFVVYEASTAVAYYMPDTRDADADGIPDWYEVVLYGTITNSANLDTDGDGFTLLEEYQKDYSPLISNSFMSGGVSMRIGGLTMVNYGGMFANWAITSSPPGLITSQSGTIKKGRTVTTENMSASVSGYRFGYWTVNGVRQADAQGMALTQVSAVVTTNLSLIANFYPENIDADRDGVPDGWEYLYMGTLSQTGDVDRDGFSLAQEFTNSYSPLISNSFVSGGVSMRGGAITVVNLGNLFNWAVSGDPVGIIATSSGIVNGATMITTENMAPIVSGYRFGYWTVNGVRQSDSMGVALSQLNVMINANVSVVSHFYPENQDSDADGVPDGWEFAYAGSLNQNSDADGDGYGISNEYFNSYSPVISNSFLVGGVSMRNGGVVTVNLQPFERVSHVLKNVVLSNWFTIWPTGQLAGATFGSASTPALGDWDGDGDVDLFLTTSNRSLRVFENVGTRYTVSLMDQSSAMGSVSSIVATLSAPFISMGDWSGDGKADLVLGGSTGRVKGVMSSGMFTSNQTLSVTFDLQVSSNRALPALMDLNGDGLRDLLVLQSNGLVGVLTNSGNALQPFSLSFWTTNLLSMPVPDATGISPADIDGDGLEDLLASDLQGRIWEFHRQSAGEFVLFSKVWAGSSPDFANRLTLTAADVDGDKDFDAWVGFAQGGLTFLRDPHLGAPSNLKAVSGADSVALSWKPNRQSRVTGYGVYRAAESNGVYAKLNEGLLAESFYEDNTAQAGTTYYYRVTTSTKAYFPGSTEGVPRESVLSDPVSGRIRQVRLWMSDYAAQVGSTAILQVSVDKADGISASGLDIRIVYDKDMLTPIGQVLPGTISVKPTPLSQSLIFSDNALTAAGELEIMGSSGVAIGHGRLFSVVFRVTSNAVPGSTSTNSFSQATLHGALGQTLNIDSTDTAIFNVTSAYSLGDVNGDGVVNMNDHSKLMLLLKSDAAPPTHAESYAGDINGDGMLTYEDIPLLLRLIHGSSINPE